MLKPVDMDDIKVRVLFEPLFDINSKIIKTDYYLEDISNHVHFNQFTIRINTAETSKR